MTTQELNDTARILVAGGKGLLAMDESNGTCDSPVGIVMGAYRPPRTSDRFSGCISLEMVKPRGPRCSEVWRSQRPHCAVSAMTALKVTTNNAVLSKTVASDSTTETL